MNKKYIALVVLAVLVVGAGAFWGGMTYQKKALAAQASTRAARFSQGLGGARNGFGGGNATAGQVIQKDDKSMTVKLMSGGSATVYFSSTTKVSKMVDTAISDVQQGNEVVASGTKNSDGSITADMIQIRPARLTNSQAGSSTLQPQ